MNKDEAIQIRRTICAEMTPEFKILLQKALDSCKRRKNEDVDEWAKRLTDDVCPPSENKDE